MNAIEHAHLSYAALPLAPEDQARADLYALIARLIFAPPDAQLLSALAGADSLPSEQTDNPLDAAWEELMLAASLIHADAVKDEFDVLFTSIGTPQVDPYASRYLAGFMMEKPLAALRADLARFGLARIAGVGELEDHLGALCETMRILIAGTPETTRQPIRAQKAFFEKHIGPWYARCLSDLRNADGANFYRKAADFIQAFFDVEAQAFDIELACDSECVQE